MFLFILYIYAIRYCSFAGELCPVLLEKKTTSSNRYFDFGFTYFKIFLVKDYGAYSSRYEIIAE